MSTYTMLRLVLVAFVVGVYGLAAWYLLSTLHVPGG